MTPLDVKIAYALVDKMETLRAMRSHISETKRSLADAGFELLGKKVKITEEEAKYVLNFLIGSYEAKLKEMRVAE